MPELKIYGLIGYPVKHSLSALMHNAVFKHLDINAEYRLFEVKPEGLEDFLINPSRQVTDTQGNKVLAINIEGFNITIPHKIKAREILRRQFPDRVLDPFMHPPSDEVSGAVNTVRRDYRDNSLSYCNTDLWGFVESLSKDLQFATPSKSVMVLGCGGAGRVAIAGLGWPARFIKKIFVYDRDQTAVAAARSHFAYLADKVEFISLKDMPAAIASCQLLVNATPLGMKHGDFSPVDKSLLHKDLSVYDVVYNRKTKLLEDAVSLGLPACQGLGMLLYQGVLAFQHWTGRLLNNTDIAIMRQALEEALKQ